MNTGSGKQVKFLCGPAAVIEESFQKATVLVNQDGKGERIMILKPEDLPVFSTKNSTSDRGGVCYAL